MALPELITVEDLFAPPERSGAEISPDGTRIAYLAPWRNRLNVWVRGVESEDDARCVTADETRSVVGFRWTDDPRWLLYLQDSGGDENWHVHRIDLDDPGSTAVDLTPFPGVRTWGLDLPAGRPGKAIVQLNTRTVGEIDLHELDIATGELTLLAQNPGQVITWLCAPDGEVYGQTLTAAGDIELSRWEGETGSLSTVVVFDGNDHPMSISPLQLTPDGTGVWIGSNHNTDRTRLARIDLATGAETEVDSHPSFDLVPVPYPSLITHPRTGELRGVRYLGERQVIQAVDPHFAEVLTKVESLSDGDVAAVSSDDAGRRWVVAFNHDRDPGVTWFYDHTTGEARELFRAHPNLDPAVLAPMVPVTIPARDGLSLPAYLTLPPGIEPTRLPLVLNVHGGPWMCDIWGFDPFVQMLANRGYAVLQVNFRGSTGYGKAHTRAAIGEFAGAMHDDLIDAVNWAVEQGYADRDRVGIYGGSYGGYAALAAVTFTPDVFAASIDYCGISDLANFMRTMPPAVRAMMANNWYTYVGDPADPAQEADMFARSPISRVEDIRTPLMVVQGANDVRVVQAESDNIVEALRARGVDVEYMVKDDEGHGFLNPENQIDMYRAADAFLARHLGGRDAAGELEEVGSAVAEGR